MKISFLRFVGFFSTFVLVFVFADAIADNGYVARARVIAAKPIVDTVYEQIEICRYQYQKPSVNSYNKNNTSGKLLGGIVGGVAGGTIGKGSGRDAAAAVGALIGSEVGDGDGFGKGEIIGGIAGGIIGNQIGKGRGKTAATAAGALIGSIVGNNIENSNSRQYSSPTAARKVRVCEIEEKPKRVIVGYEVDLEHDNFRFSEVIDYRPEQYVDIYINVEVLSQESVSQR